LNGTYDKIGEAKYQQVAEVVLHGDQRKIVRFLLEQGYIETVNHSIPNYKLMRKGFDAKNAGGHEAYIEQQRIISETAAAEVAKEKREQKLISLPQKYWWAVTRILSTTCNNCNLKCIINRLS
jgi:hypothetical protein